MIERIPIKKNPKLFDKVIAEVQQRLAEDLPWLTHSFGKAERLVKVMPNGKKYFTPNLYIGRNEYELIAPDSNLGNYSFFVIDEPQNIEYARGTNNKVTTPFSIIFWLDMRTIEDEDERNTEAVKQDILQALSKRMFLQTGSITINRVYEKAENVFQGFTLDEIDNQFLMHPYAGFRFYGEMQTEDECIEL